MQFRLRTLLIVLALGPPVLWTAWLAWKALRSSPAPAEYNIGHKLDLDVF